MWGMAGFGDGPPRRDSPADPEWDGRRPRPRQPAELVFAALTSIGLLLLGYGYLRYVSSVEGAARAAALFAGALVVLGGLMLAWSYFRQHEDFLEKLLSGAGQSVLLGAILSFGFAVTGQLAEDERAAREDERAKAAAEQDSRRALAAAVRVDAGGKTFPDVDLRGQNLNGLDLSDFNFVGADMRGATLVRADLSRASLAGANLAAADLSMANLTEADLYMADLSDADLSGADLTDANLAGADLTGADWSSALLARMYVGPRTTCPDGSSPEVIDDKFQCPTGRSWPEAR